MTEVLSTDRYHGCCFCYSGSKARYNVELKEVIPKEDNLKVLDVFAGAGSVTTALPLSWEVTGNDAESRIIDIHRGFQEALRERTSEEVAKWVIDYCHSQVLNNQDEEGFEILKSVYNQTRKPQDLYALITSSNSNYMRFNKSGEFNVKFGKRYLNPSLQKKLSNYLGRVQERNIAWESKDFREFDFNEYGLLIVDPPYAYNGKSVATYNERGGWQLQDLVNLLSKLDKAHENGVKFIFFNEAITKNVDNPIIQEWISKYNVKILKDTLTGCSYQRTNKRSVEVLVKNF